MNNILIAFCVLLFSLNAEAVKTDNASLIVTATVRNNTCSVSSDSQMIIINMGFEATKFFYQTGVEARDNPFYIILENCGASASGVKASLTGSAHPANPSVFMLDNPQDVSTAKNIGIKVYDKSGKPVKPGGNSDTYVLNGADSNLTGLRFVARYISTAIPVTPGRADGSLTFTLTYD
jgi:major type 1 subunit fimbrin (pilin)